MIEAIQAFINKIMFFLDRAVSFVNDHRILSIAVGAVIFIITTIAGGTLTKIGEDIFDGIKKHLKPGHKSLHDDFEFKLTSEPAPPRDNDPNIRKEHINSLKKQIRKNHKALICGFGGMGKTHTARTLFHELKNKYEHIAWIPYQAEGTLESSIISSFLCLEKAEEAEIKQLMPQIKSFLMNADHHTALFIDDVPEEIGDTFLNDVLNSGLTVVLTSRQTKLGTLQGICLDQLSAEACVKLFYSYYQEDAEQAHKATVLDLVGLVNCHTLSVELLAKGVEPGQSLENYLQTLKAKGFGFPNLKFTTGHTNQMKTLAQHYKKLFDLEELGRKRPELVRILQNFAVMPGGIIPRDIKDWISCDINDLQELVRKGWLSWNNGYSMHDIVRLTVRLAPIPEEALSAFIACVGNGQFFKSRADTEVYTVVQRKIEIAEAVLGQSSLENLDYAYACHNLATALYHMAMYGKALKYYQRALEIKQAVYGENHPDTADSYNNLGVVYDEQGDYPKALEHHQKALEIKKTVFGESHPDTAVSYNNLGLVYYRQGDCTKALELYQKALETYISLYDENHSSTADTYNNLGIVYADQGDYPKALEHYQKALEMYISLYGEIHSSTATTYNNLGSVYAAQGDYPKALVHFQKALETYIALYGEIHTFTAVTYDNLGNVYRNQGDYTKALVHFQKALEIQKKVPGESHPSTATTYNNLGIVYADQGNYPKALEHHQKALEIKKTVYGESHPDTASSYGNLGIVYGKQGNFQKALEHFQKALEIQKKVPGESHPDTAATYNNLGVVYSEMGEHAKAAELDIKAYRIRLHKLRPEHPDTKRSYRNLQIDYANLRPANDFDTWLADQLAQVDTPQ